MGDNIDEAIRCLDKFNLICKDKNCEFHNKCTYGCRERAMYKGSIYDADSRMCGLLKKIYE